MLRFRAESRNKNVTFGQINLQIPTRVHGSICVKTNYSEHKLQELQSELRLCVNFWRFVHRHGSVWGCDCDQFWWRAAGEEGTWKVLGFTVGLPGLKKCSKIFEIRCCSCFSFCGNENCCTLWGPGDGPWKACTDVYCTVSKCLWCLFGPRSGSELFCDCAGTEERKRNWTHFDVWNKIIIKRNHWQKRSDQITTKLIIAVQGLDLESYWFWPGNQGWNLLRQRWNSEHEDRKDNIELWMWFRSRLEKN